MSKEAEEAKERYRGKKPAIDILHDQLATAHEPLKDKKLEGQWKKYQDLEEKKKK